MESARLGTMRRGRRKGDGGLTGKRHLRLFFSSPADERDPRVKEQGHAVRRRVLRTRDAGKEAGLCAHTCGLRASASASWAALLAGLGWARRGREGRPQGGSSWADLAGPLGRARVSGLKGGVASWACWRRLGQGEGREERRKQIFQFMFKWF